MTKSDTRSELVFIYGTARRGASNAFRMADAEFVAEGLTRGKLVAISLYPGLVPGSHGFAKGDLFRLNPEQMAAFAGDADGHVEGRDFRRRLVKVHPHNLGQQTVDAWAWEWTGEQSELPGIPGGDWLEWEIPRMTPWLTGIAFICLIFLPAGLLAGVQLVYPTSSAAAFAGHARAAAGICNLLAILSPPAGLLALWIGHRRRERWGSLRILLLPLLALASIPVLLMLLGAAVAAFTRLR